MTAATLRLTHPAVATTALGAIPGGLLMFAMTGQILQERGQYKGIPQLSVDAMHMFKAGFTASEIRLDGAYQATLPEFYTRRDALTNDDLPGVFAKLYR